MVLKIYVNVSRLEILMKWLDPFNFEPKHLHTWPLDLHLHIQPKISYASLGEIDKQTSQQE